MRERRRDGAAHDVGVDALRLEVHAEAESPRPARSRKSAWSRLCSVTTQIAITGLPRATSGAMRVEDAVVRALAARGDVRRRVAVEAGVDQVGARQPLGVAVEERQVRVDAHEEAAGASPAR